MSPAVPSFALVTFIGAEPQVVWQALTDPDLTADYWDHRNESTWEPGDTWRHLTLDEEPTVEVAGTVLATERHRLLQFTFEDPSAVGRDERPSVVTFALEGGEGITRLRILHDHLATPEDRAEVAHGWSAVAANLKTLVETGRPLPQRPWLLRGAGGGGAGGD